MTKPDAIPHSDDSLHSDGSGYTIAPVSEAVREIIRRREDRRRAQIRATGAKR